VVEVFDMRAVNAAGKARRGMALLGPAFVAAIAYVDPGNFATNFAGGAVAGYELLWVVMAANLVAMFVQSLTAKLGLATGRDLAELCRERYHPWVARLLWAQAEIVAMATDVAEIIGGALALHLLFEMPLLLGGLVTAAVAFVLLALHGRGHRPFELVVTGLLLVVFAGIVFNLLRAEVDLGAMAAGVVPRLPTGDETLMLAAGILGATVMPHVVYLHSALTAHRTASVEAGGGHGQSALRGKPLPALAGDIDRRALRRLLIYQRVDILIALGIAGLVNVAMLISGAALFHGHHDAKRFDELDAVQAGLAEQLGSSAAVAFAVALLASGFASSGVGTLAGQVVMQGFLRLRIPLPVRRAVTVLPALVVLGTSTNLTQALVVSQVVLSFGIPFALIPLVLLTRRVDVMGELVNRESTTVAAWVAALGIVAVNAWLVIEVVVG
jgi:manganese transport protein